MTFPSSIPPAHVAEVIDGSFDVDGSPRVSIDAARLPCEDTFVECPACERHWAGKPERPLVRHNVKMRFSRYAWAVAHPLRPEVVSAPFQFGLWIGQCRDCGTVYFGERPVGALI